MRTSGLVLALAVITALIAGTIMGFVSAPLKASTQTMATGESYIEIAVPAIDEEGKGMTTKLSVETFSGNGKILTNIDKLLFWTDTQASIQTARMVAENYTRLNTSNIDMIYTINNSNVTIVGGPSAGAALTIATIAALEHRQINNSVMMTGTIYEDGTIGKVGGVVEKAKAAKSYGATLFLVPVGEGTETVLTPKESCSQKYGYLYCETKYVTSAVNISDSTRIEIREVSTITEAARYFLV